MSISVRRVSFLTGLRNRGRSFFRGENNWFTIHWVIILAGLIIRFLRYWENPSLWLDECYVAMGIINVSWRELVQHTPLFPDQPQRALGFYLIEKFLVTILGNQESVLRLFPFLAGMGSLILFYRYIRRVLSPLAVMFALLLFSFSEHLIYHLVEVKQYSVDVLVCLLLYLFYERILKEGLSFKNSLRLGEWGSVALWFSHASLFVLAGMGTVLLVKSIGQKKYRDWRLPLIPAVLWMFNFLVIYKLTLRGMVDNQYLLGTFEGSFPCWQEGVSGFASWLGRTFMEMFNSPLGVSFPIIAVGFFLYGVFKSWREERWQVLSLPVLFVLMAAIMQKYPFKDRLILFLMPAVMMFIAQGAFVLAQKGSRYLIVALVGMGLILFRPLTDAGQNFFVNHAQEENREVLQYLKKYLRPTDQIVMNNSARYPFWYYWDQMHLGDLIPKTIITVDGRQFLLGPLMGKFYDQRDLFKGGPPFVLFCFERYVFTLDNRFYRLFVNNDLLRTDYRFRNDRAFDICPNERVWVFFSEIKPELRSLILQTLNRQGRLVQKYERLRAAVYLYDLRPGSPAE